MTLSPMQITTNTTDRKATIKLDGRFDFSASRDFRSSYESILGQRELESIEIDLSSVSYLDSSALGMLLLLREKTEPTNAKLSLVNSRGAVRQILEVANFHKLFTLR
ncbi:STAS-domain containing protein PA14_20770 [Gammaproteobacteria bacterium]